MSEAKVIAACQAAGFTDIYKKSLRTITDMEKVMTKPVLPGDSWKPGHKTSRKANSGSCSQTNEKKSNLQRRNSMKANTKVVTGKETRLSYFNGWKPVSINGGEEKYSTQILIPKNDLETLSAIEKGSRCRYR